MLNVHTALPLGALARRLARLVRGSIQHVAERADRRRRDQLVVRAEQQQRLGDPKTAGCDDATALRKVKFERVPLQRRIRDAGRQWGGGGGGILSGVLLSPSFTQLVFQLCSSDQLPPSHCSVNKYLRVEVEYPQRG